MLRTLTDFPRRRSTQKEAKLPTVTKTLGDGTQSVLLTVAILERLAQKNGPLSISELARDIGTSKSRIFRHLQTLTSCDYVAANPTSGEYEVGSQLLAFCRAINERYDLVNLALPIMSDLRDRLGHTVIISRADTSGVLVLKTISGNSPIVVGIRPGTTLPFEGSAQGKVAMAFMPAQRQEEQSPFARAYKIFSTNHADEIEIIQRQGWAGAQMREGLYGVAAPVFDSTGRLVATVALLDTVTDMGADIDPRKIDALTGAARDISQELARAGIRSA